jgi:parallel beta-helix repeat protein
MKTLDQVEPRTAITSMPYTITQPGSYFLTGNLTGAGGSGGILIRTNNVTLDLNGFSVIGTPGDTEGIRVTSASRYVVVRNGSILSWPSTALLLGSLSDSQCVAEDLFIKASSFYAVSAAGARLERCTVEGGTGYGIYADYSMLVECRVRGAAVGIRAGNGRVTSCDVLNCSSNGYEVSDSLVESCSAESCVGNGFHVFDDSSLKHVRALNCTYYGIYAGARVTVEDALVSIGQYGILVGPGSIVRHCVVNGTSVGGILAPLGASVSECEVFSNVSGPGISVGNQSLVSMCVVYSNGQDGITMGNWGRVEGCTVRDNGGDGIEVGNGCYVVNNVIQHNGAAGASAGINATVPSSRIEGNNVEFNNDKGIWAQFANNTIFKNTLRNNGTSDVSAVAGNDVGPLGTAAASTSPWANIQF